MEVFELRNPNDRPRVSTAWQKMNFLGVDPGKSVGVAVVGNRELLYHDTATCPKGTEPIPHALAAGNLIAGWCDEFNVQVVGIEWPAFYNTAAGMASASKGHVVSLVCSAALILSQLERCDVEVYLVKPHHWKGQLPKEIAWKRTFMSLDRSSEDDFHCDEHAKDAAGIAAWLKGYTQ